MVTKKVFLVLLLCSISLTVYVQGKVMTSVMPLTQYIIDTIPQKHREQFAQFDNQAVIQGMLEGRHPGTLLRDADDISGYTLIKSGGPYAFLAGTPTEDDLHAIYAKLDEYPSILLLCDAALQNYFLERGFTLQPRLAFTSPTTQIGTVSEYPAGYTIKLIDSPELLKRCLWAQPIADWYGSSEHFLKHGFGYVLISDTGDIAAEVYAAFIGNQSCEIGIITNPAYHQRGYASLMVQQIIQECHQRGITPLWSCRADNAASIKTALKNGFVFKNEYAEYAFVKKGGA